MTVSSETNKVSFVGNGSTTSWFFPFSTPDAASISVYVQGADGTIAKQSPGSYLVVLNPLVGTNPTVAGGRVDFPLSGLPLASGFKIVIVREIPAVQNVSLTNQSIIYPPVIEREFDYLTMLAQRGAEVVSRAFHVEVTDPPPKATPQVSIRKNQWAFFDNDGELVPGSTPGGTVFISAVMQPVVGASTLSLARTLMGIGTTKLITGAYGVANDENGTIFNLMGAAFYVVGIGPAAGFPIDFRCTFINNDTRGKLISIDGYTPFILWPSQATIVTRDGASGWQYIRSGRWHSATGATFQVDYTNGSDGSDGLGTFGQAFKTLQHAVIIIENEVDGPFNIHMALGTHDVGIGVYCGKPILGAYGYTISGEPGAPANTFLIGSTGTVISATNNASLKVTGIQPSIANGNCIGASYGAVVELQYIRFGFAPGGYHMFVINNATLNVSAPYSVYAGTDTHILAQASSTVYYNPGTVIIENPMNITSNFINCNFNSTVYASGVVSFTNPGNVTGKKYTVSFNGSVNSGGSTFPGTIAGTTSTGGVYA